MSATEFASTLGEKFPRVSPRASGDCPAFDVAADDLLAVLRHLRDEEAFDLLTDISGIDWGVDQHPRFSVAYHLLSTRHFGYVRVVTPCTEDEPPIIPSVVSLWPGADWHERETYDMFGIVFDGHPDLRRILMWEGYPYYPMRKDFPLAGIDTELPDEEVAAATNAKVRPAPMAGGPFVAPQAEFMSKREPRARDESWNERSPKPE